MPRGQRQGQLTCSELRKRIGIGDNTNEKSKPLKLIELLRLAKEKKVINDVELQTSLPTTISTTKCYLHSLIEDKDVRQTIDDYVSMSSILYTRASLIMNMIVYDEFGPIVHYIEKPKFDFTINDNVTKCFEFINSGDFKHCILPERWPSGKVERNSLVAKILHSNSEILKVFLPDWSTLMNTTGWDNAINRMASKLFVNIKNHTSVHLMRFVKSYLTDVKINKGTDRDLLIKIIDKPLFPMSNCHNDDFEFCYKIREMLNRNDIDNYIQKNIEFDINSFNLMMFLVKIGVTNGTYLPVSTIGRKYCYLDKKICQFLLPKLYKQKKQELKRDPEVMELFEITYQGFSKRRKILRQKLRKLYKNNNLKLKKKWSEIGYSNIPRNCKIYSIETDGVGVSLSIQRPVSLHKSKIINRNPENPVIVGTDTGRSKLFASSISSDPLKKPESIVYTRHQYYHDIKNNIVKHFNKTRSQQPEIKNALLDLAELNGKENFPNYVENLSKHFETIKSEYIDNKEHALWAMRVYRLKRRALDKAVNRVIERANGRDIVIGYGDASFASGGKGEVSVPTTSLEKAFLRAALRSLQIIKIIRINEFKTTLCCCSCGSCTLPLKRSNDKNSCRIRLCTNCSKNDVALRDRDIQAARNILWLTQYKFLGCERPDYLSRPRRT